MLKGHWWKAENDNVQHWRTLCGHFSFKDSIFTCIFHICGLMLSTIKMIEEDKEWSFKRVDFSFPSCLLSYFIHHFSIRDEDVVGTGVGHIPDNIRNKCTFM